LTPPDDTTGAHGAGAPRRMPWATGTAIAALLLASAVMLWRLYKNSLVKGPTSFDIYAYAYPMFIHAADAVRQGGAGLLWNPYQSCGEPYLGIGTSGLLYPPSWLFLLLPPDAALYGLLFCNLAIGALGGYALARALRLGRAAAVCGGLAFAFSNQGADLISFTPIVSGPYAWLPVAMCCTERLLREARVAWAVALAAALAISLLPGHPQVIVYLYQLIALRIAWELIVVRPPRPGRLLALFAGSLACAPLLAGLHLVPALESMRQSIRSGSLSAGEISSHGGVTWSGFLTLFSRRQEINNPIHLLPSLLAINALLTRVARPQMWFYLLVGLLSLGLALGDRWVLFPYYRMLPAGSLFRDPNRFLWITSLCLSVLAAVGADAVLRAAATWPRRIARLALPIAVAAALWAGSKHGFYWHEPWLIAATLAAMLLAATAPRATSVAVLLLVGALALDLIWWRTPPFRHFIDGAQLYARQPAFEQLQAHLTPQDRVYLVGRHADHSLQHKSGSLFGIPVMTDYESQTSRRWADYFTYLRIGRGMQNINDLLYPVQGYLPPTLVRPLFDLTASRYLMVEESMDQVEQIADPPMAVVSFSDGVRVYENTEALPRARWVPRAEVAESPAAVLKRLAQREIDPRITVLLEEPPPSGVPRGAAQAGGAVSFTRDDPESIELSVDAPAAGFVVLADQYFPGWRASVNGVDTPILRANYAFRAVEVPAGHSTVDFRFRPPSVALGASLSAISIAAALALLWQARRRGW
jgi:hypothetical protein